MRSWQRTMIRLARSPRVKEMMQTRASLSALVRKFIGGSSLSEALATCRSLRDEGLRASLFYLGEYESDPAIVRRTVEQKRAAASALGEAKLDVHVSVDPTQIGHLLSIETMRANALAIGRSVRAAAARRSGAGVDLLMLDMEDETLVDDTLSLHRTLVADGGPAGVTLQANLRRTAADLRPLVAAGARVRLVKGAFAPGRDVAYRGARRIRESYAGLAAIMLSGEARRSGFYPSFATHDEHLVAEIERLAGAVGWRPGNYELEVLHGVRSELQRSLAARGHRVRAYPSARIGGRTPLGGSARVHATSGSC